ncbi:MAG: esterase family protein [Thermoplasmata archaeon]|nr:esterase family protein [Thermoplasmata archaeon]
MKGSTGQFSIESQVLRDNPWGDPTNREVAYYTPPSGRTEGLPLLVQLSGFTGAGWMEFQRHGPFHESLVQLFDRMIRTGECPEAVIVAPDCLTTLGGSQYVNSAATGRYADHVATEVVPQARERFRSGATGVLGQSSGGFGALHLGVEYPRVFQAVGSSAGDAAFEYSYLPDFPQAFREFRKAGGPEKWMERLFSDPSVLKGHLDSSGAALNTLAMASCYSPSPDPVGSFELPFELESGALDPRVWNRWLEFDPVRRLSDGRVQHALRGMKSVHVTGSDADEWYLDLGARMFAVEAERVGIRVHHDELPGSHFARNPRFAALYPRMVNALTA